MRFHRHDIITPARLRTSIEDETEDSPILTWDTYMYFGQLLKRAEQINSDVSSLRELELYTLKNPGSEFWPFFRVTKIWWPGKESAVERRSWMNACDPVPGQGIFGDAFWLAETSWREQSCCAAWLVFSFHTKILAISMIMATLAGSAVRRLLETWGYCRQISKVCSYDLTI